MMITGCQLKDSSSDIKVLADEAKGNLGQVVNGGPGSTEVIYSDGFGDTWETASNTVRVPIAAECVSPDEPLVAELAPPLADAMPNPYDIPTSVAVNSFHNHLLVAAKRAPEPIFTPEKEAPLSPPKITLVKSADQDVLCCDRDLTFRIRFINEGGKDAYNVNISDVVPANVEYLEASAGSEPFYSNIDLQRNEKGLVSKVSWVIPGPIPPGAEGEVVYAVGCQVNRPILNCYIHFSPPALNVGQSGEVTCSVTNSGDGPSKKTKLFVNIPSGLEYEGEVNGKSLEFDLGDVPAGETVSKNLTVTLRDGGKLDTITSRIEAANYECDCSVPPAPTLELVKTGPEEKRNAEPIEYTIVVRNTSERDAPATNCVLTDKLPKDSEFVSAENEGVYDENAHTVTWYLGTMLPGAMETRKTVVRPTVSGTLRNEAEVTCEEGIRLQDEVITNVKGFSAMHIAKYDTEDPVAVGDTTTYVIEVRNEGFKRATGVILENEIPELSEYVTAQGVGPTGEILKPNIDGDKIVFDTLPVLESGDKVVYQVTVRITGAAEGKLLNRSSLRYNEFHRIIVVEEPTTSYE